MVTDVLTKNIKNQKSFFVYCNIKRLLTKNVLEKRNKKEKSTMCVGELSNE